MSSHQWKIIRDHAKAAGHLVGLWDRSDWRWYAREKFWKVIR